MSKSFEKIDCSKVFLLFINSLVLQTYSNSHRNDLTHLLLIFHTLVL